MSRRWLSAVVVSAAVLVMPRVSPGLFHLAEISELMTSYGGNDSVQFIEIRMDAAGQEQVAHSVFAAFDSSGAYTGDILEVPANVLNPGASIRWLVGTSQFQSASGITPDFIIPASLPTPGGMICWGGGGGVLPQNPPSWSRTNFSNYVDCIAYGGYSGPSNLHIGTPTALNAVGHSLVRVGDTNNSSADFACADPATPTNNQLPQTPGLMPATSPCLAAPTPTPTVAPAGAGLDHFMSYKIKTTKYTPKFLKFGAVTLTDQFGAGAYEVLRPTQLGLPADKNAEGVNDAATHLEEYQLKRLGTRFTPLDARVVNQCNDLVVSVRKPVSLLVPTNKSLSGPVPPPGAANVDHFLCYQAKARTKLPAGIQVDVVDQFQQRRYELKRITKLCNPVAKSGAPRLLAGPDKGSPKSITPAAILHPADHLVCYKAALARKFIAQNGCGPATPGDRGTAMALQPKHLRRIGLYLNNQFGAERVDTVKEREVCIPSLKNPTLAGVELFQLDWLRPDGSLGEQDSLWGRMHYSFRPPAALRYANLLACSPVHSTCSWVIRNLPLFPNPSPAERREAVDFNLAELGVVRGEDVSSLDVAVTVTDAPQASPPPPSAVLPAPVGTMVRRASDQPQEAPNPGPFVTAGAPAGVKLAAAPQEIIPEREMGSVQEADSHCAAGAFARSLDWLNRQFGYLCCINAQGFYDQLVSHGVSNPEADKPENGGNGGGTSRDEWIKQKADLADAASGGRVKTKVWDPGGMVDPIPGVPEQNGDFLDWLQGELRAGEDVEVAYFYPGNAHIVTITGMYTEGGKTYVKYRDDEHQADNTKGDDRVKTAEIYQKDGNYHFGSDDNTIYFAVSESDTLV